MKKQNKKFTSISLAKPKYFTIVILLMLGAAIFAVQKIAFYNAAADRANLVEVRELILLAARGIKKDAPVDPKTGDVFFPESRLYLPNPKTTLPLTYLFDNDVNQLSISTYPILGTTRLYTASNQNDLFAAVPKFQACSRGIKLTYQKLPASDTNDELKHDVRLGGKHLFLYVEKDCPELNDLAGELTKIRTY